MAESPFVGAGSCVVADPRPSHLMGVSLYSPPSTSGSGGVSPPASSEAVRFVSGGGNDSSDGLTSGSPKLTLAAAYANLPATGGVIYAAPGRYDVGSGFALTRGKVLALVGTTPPPVYVNSASTAPLSFNCAILYTSTGAASLVTTIAGTAATDVDGLKFHNLLFEVSNASTLVALDLTACSYTEITGCYFFADKTTGPAAVTAQGFYIRGDVTYGGAGTDCSWSRVWNNRVMNMALGTFGNATGTKYSNNQQVCRENVGLGLTHSNTSALPFVSFYGGHRCIERDNNIEAYNRGVFMGSCWMSVSEGSGGEFVDFFVDMTDCKGCRVSPLGISYTGLGSSTPILAGAKLVRGDAFTKACVIILPTTWTAANTQRLYPPLDDATNPAIDIATTDNVIISSRNNTNQGLRTVYGTGSPNTAILGSVGDFFLRTDGGASTILYVKETGTNTNTGWVAYGAPSSALPTQTGNNGKFLTTDGTTASWGTAGAGPLNIVARQTDAAARNSGNTGSTLTADDTLLFAISGVSGDVYFVEMVLLFTTGAAGATMDAKVSFTVPAGASSKGGYGFVAGSAGFPGSPASATSYAPSAPLAAAGPWVWAMGNSDAFFARGEALVTSGGTSGNVVLNWAQNTSDAANLILAKGSHLRVTKVV